jgi:hypothetical protein
MYPKESSEKSGILNMVLAIHRRYYQLGIQENFNRLDAMKNGISKELNHGHILNHIVGCWSKTSTSRNYQLARGWINHPSGGRKVSYVMNGAVHELYEGQILM